MGEIYSAPMDALAFTTLTDVFQITAASTDRCIIHQLDLGQALDLGDAAEEVLRIGLFRAPTAGTGGTAAIEVAYKDTNSGGVTASVLMNNTTASTGGTLLGIIPWNIRIPLQYVWTPETRIMVEESGVLAFRLVTTAPIDSLTISGTLIWEE